MKPCYIVNDYAQTQGVVALTRYDKHRARREDLFQYVDISEGSIFLATLSNAQKMDPAIFHVWMNIMHRYAGSKMIHIGHDGHEIYAKYMKQYANYFGITKSRMVMVPQIRWIDHLYAKTALDLILDTPAKNAHSTGLDGIFAGIPTVTLAGGGAAESRAGESIATALGSGLGLAYSLKDYEDLAYRALEKRKAIKMKALLAKQSQGKGTIGATSKKGLSHLKIVDVKHSLSEGQFKVGSGLPKKVAPLDSDKFLQQYPLLVAWREEVSKKRVTSTLFNTKLWTKSFEFMLQASWEIAHLKKYYKAVKSLSPRENHDAETTNRIILQANTSGLGTSYYQIFSPVSDEHSTWSKEKGFNKQIELDQAETKGSELIPDELLSELQQIRSSHKSKLEENMRSSPIVEDGYYDGDGLGGLTEEQRSFLLERGFLFQIVDGSL
jgi:hypothetical protein